MYFFSEIISITIGAGGIQHKTDSFGGNPTIGLEGALRPRTILAIVGIGGDSPVILLSYKVITRIKSGRAMPEARSAGGDQGEMQFSRSNVRARPSPRGIWKIPGSRRTVRIL